MLIHRAYKTELDPTAEQRQFFLQHAGAARFAYNWGLRRCINAHERGEKRPTGYDLRKELDSIKDAEFPWMREVSCKALHEAVYNVDKAFKHFFRRLKAGDKPGFPNFKSRARGIGGFTLRGCIHVRERHIVLPRIGAVRLKEAGYLPPVNVKILAANVSERAGRWFVSLQVEETVPDPEPRVDPVVGVDVGIKSLAVCSDGTVFDNPRALAAKERKLARLQRSVSRKKKGSANRKKAVAKVARLHYRIACTRSDALHKASSAISKAAGTVVIEDLNVKGMKANRCLAKAVSDASMSELHRQLTYKQEWSGGQVVTANRWYASSKTCSECGCIKSTLSLSERTFRCDDCGFTCDRDENAARNLRNVALKARETQNACGESVSGALVPVALCEAGTV